MHNIIATQYYKVNTKLKSGLNNHYKYKKGSAKALPLITIVILAIQQSLESYILLGLSDLYVTFYLS